MQHMLPSLSVLSPQCYSLRHPICFCFSDHCSLILMFIASKIGIFFFLKEKTTYIHTPYGLTGLFFIFQVFPGMEEKGRCLTFFLVHSTTHKPNLKLRFSCSNNGTEGAEITRKIPNTESFTMKLVEEAILNSHFQQLLPPADSTSARKGTTPFPQQPSSLASVQQRETLSFCNKAGGTLCSLKKHLIKLHSRPKQPVDLSTTKLSQARIQPEQTFFHHFQVQCYGLIQTALCHNREALMDINKWGTDAQLQTQNINFILAIAGFLIRIINFNNKKPYFLRPNCFYYN